ncbi:MAG TPA: ATP-binding cassette domain-containing protein [Solirubrobacteraceae bacterium]
MPLLEVTGLCKRYPDGSRELVVLNDASFEIFEDDFVGLWGLRRAGKSTLLRILAGLEAPDSGSVRFDGIELTTLSSDARVRLLRNQLALASFGWATHRNRSVCEHVALAACADHRMTGRSARVLARRALHRLAVVECAERPLDRLSLDEQIRVELARAIVRGPRLLLIDDPPVLQSPTENTELHELLRSLGEEAGRAVMLSACDTAPIQHVKRTMALGRGRLRTMDAPGTVLPFPDRTGTGGP